MSKYFDFYNYVSQKKCIYPVVFNKNFLEHNGMYLYKLSKAHVGANKKTVNAPR